MEKKVKEPRGFYVGKGSFFAHASVIILIFSVAARLFGTMDLWGNIPALSIQTILPIGCALLFILFILLLGRIALWTTILPVLGGAAFYILSALDEGMGWPLFICIALAFLASFIYTATLAGMIRTKWLLVPIFALILAYQIVFRAIPAFGNTVEPLSFLAGMKLLSSLGLVLAMFCASLALRRRKVPAEKPELPKIKDPKVVPPEEEPKTETSAPETDAQIPSDSAPAAETTEESTAPAPEIAAEERPIDITEENEKEKE